MGFAIGITALRSGHVTKNMVSDVTVLEESGADRAMASVSMVVVVLAYRMTSVRRRSVFGRRCATPIRAGAVVVGVVSLVQIITSKNLGDPLCTTPEKEQIGVVLSVDKGNHALRRHPRGPWHDTEHRNARLLLVG